MIISVIMGAGKMYRVNKHGQSSNNYGGGHTGKGKKGRSVKRQIRSVYAHGYYSILKKTPKNGEGCRVRTRISNVMNPKWYGIVYL